MRMAATLGREHRGVSTALVVLHHPDEGPYEIGRALEARGVGLDVRLAGRDPLPGTTEGFAAVVVMGGPQAAYDDDGFPTRVAEISLLADALVRGTPTLAVCLGAQLLAEAAGGRSYAGAAGPEVGWHPVHLSGQPDPLFDDLPSTFIALHWHGDTFDLPPGAVHLARSDTYEHQAFRVGDGAWGIQFHVEVDEPAVDAFVRQFDGDPAISAGAPSQLDLLRPVRTALLDRFAERLAPG
jgi:GMP synthase-like glutamine amidotransferase